MDEYKEIVKQTYIKNNGEEAYYSEIASRLDTLIYMKNSIDTLGDYYDMTEKEKRSEFKRGVIDAIIEDCDFDEAEQLYNIAMYEIAFDVFEF